VDSTQEQISLSRAASKTKLGSLSVSDEVFVIPSGEDFLVYIPLLGNVLRANLATVSLLQGFDDAVEIDPSLKAQLIAAGVLVYTQTNSATPGPPSKDFSPTHVTLFTTSDCNLRCVYCYARAGCRQHVMQWKHAKAAIDFAVENATKTHAESFSIDFHGGGEPTFGEAWHIVTESVTYSKAVAASHGLNFRSSLGTNAVLDETKLNWIVENIDSVGVSLDGPADIHNRQRPSASGSPTFDSVMRSIKVFEQKHFPYDIRVTITNSSVNRMLEIARFIFTNTTRKSCAMEPVTVCGRCSESRVTDVDADIFLSNIMACEAEFPQARIHYSAVNLKRPHHVFCGACGSNFAVTPQGHVTSCNEVSMVDDPLASDFFFGQYNEASGRYDIDSSQLSRLRGRTVENMAFCQDCFAKYSCAGDCPVRVARITGDMMDASGNGRCEITRGLLLHKLNNRQNT